MVVDRNAPEVRLARVTSLIWSDWPAWSPDGTTLAVAGETDAGPGIYLLDPDGTNPRRISQAELPVDAHYLQPQWSPDGKQLAYFAGTPNGRDDVYVVNADGSGEHAVAATAASEFWPTWSPDGNWIAFDRDCDPSVCGSAPGNDVQIVVAHADGTGAYVLSSPVSDMPPVWAPDGSKLFARTAHAVTVPAPRPIVDIVVDGILVFDLVGGSAPVHFPVTDYGGFSNWQRLAP